MYSEFIALENGITSTQKRAFLENLIDSYDHRLNRVLIIPPDFTRFHSNAGELAEILYNLLRNRCEITILPALGTHAPLTHEEKSLMFGNIPKENFLTHDWRNDVVDLGIIPSDFIEEISEQKLHYPIKVEINKHLKTNFDLIISIGQVVPHEVAGMANGNKNILVGVGGSDMINKSHFLGACYGIERIMGRIPTPVRDLFDYVFEMFLEDLPLIYVQTVMKSNTAGKIHMKGLFGGEKNVPFRKAAKLSQKLNITFLDKPLEKVVVYLDPTEYKSTWVGNKAIYRTRMALIDNGELIILAPGLNRLGEDKTIDRLIRKYGYGKTNEILNAVENNNDLRENLSAAAHLIHGSSEDRFKITYCTSNIIQEEIMKVNYLHKNLSETEDLYNPRALIEGYNSLPTGEEIYFIQNPALGLWTTKKRFLKTM
ncbi:D-mannonate epimerase [Candidatus Heimdallarchaeota archaeon B3_Heim]|nr:MAG: D-mannonate epimerase [Candidatus Heimdallarchaeota archaeon B3_Heim]